MSFFKSFFVLVACIAVSASAQSNITTPSNVTIPLNITIPPITIPVTPYTYLTALATCPLRDQILRLNQLLAIENLNLAFFQQLLTRMSNVSETANIGLPAGVNLVELRGNLSTIISQISNVTAYLNSTITTGCSSLFDADDRSECYVWAPCNYTFGNITALGNTTVTPAPTVAPSNNTANHTQNSTTTNNTASLAPSASAVRTVLSQGWYMSDQSVDYYIATIVLVSNSTVQWQLMEFEAMHAQQSTYLRLLTEQQPIITPFVLSNSNLNTYNRPNIVASYANFVADRQCCDGFRGVRPSGSS